MKTLLSYYLVVSVRAFMYHAHKREILTIRLSPPMLTNMVLPSNPSNQSNWREFMDQHESFSKRQKYKKTVTKSENFIIEDVGNTTFDDVGGYDSVKDEMLQCSDVLINPEKYAKFNVRAPKGMILEGPPGNGKTLLAKAFCGELKASFISASSSSLQEKYVGVGSSRLRELFKLASENTPCIIFMDEIDAIGRSRGDGSESSSSERDNTLNELLIQLDGFKTPPGIFVIFATNRIDLLDNALLRPGRIDKKIYVGNPDTSTRFKIIQIHVRGKPLSFGLSVEYIVDITNGMSGAEIENMLNEAMLSALRKDKESIDIDDIMDVTRKMQSGHQVNENTFSKHMLEVIATHEIGHAVTGMLLKSHSRLSRVHLNAWSPKSPGYTVFETDEVDANIFTKERLFSHLVVLLSGRNAELIFFNGSITTGASKDFEQAHMLAKQMIMDYGMGSQNVYPHTSDKFKEKVDDEINELLISALDTSTFLLKESAALIMELSKLLLVTKTIDRAQIDTIIYGKHSNLYHLKLPKRSKDISLK